MTRPVVDASTERLYSRLPEFYRSTDEAQTSADGAEDEYYPLLRFISGIGYELSLIDELIYRFDYSTNGVTSDLVDPLTANSAWIPWLASLTGVLNAGEETGTVETASFQQILTAADTAGDANSITTWSELYALDAGTGVTWQTMQDLNAANRTQFLGSRAIIKNRQIYGYDEGTRGSIIRVVKSVLTGTSPYCFVGSRTEAIAQGITTSPAPNANDPWNIYIVVKNAEAPSVLSTILPELIEPVKPAGLIHTLVYKTP